MDPKLEQEQRQIEADRARLELRQRELNGKKMQWHEDQHEERKAECRAAKAELDRLEREKEAAKAAWIQAEGAHKNAHRHVSEHHERSNGRWLGRDEILINQSKLEELQKKRLIAQDAEGSARREYDSLIYACRAARERLDEASRKEYECRTKLGPARHDSGFSVTAQDGDDGITMIRTA
jgi:hypothetical protein